MYIHTTAVYGALALASQGTSGFVARNPSLPDAFPCHLPLFFPLSLNVSRYPSVSPDNSFLGHARGALFDRDQILFDLRQIINLSLRSQSNPAAVSRKSNGKIYATFMIEG